MLRNEKPTEAFEVGDSLTVEINYDVREALIHPCAAIGVCRDSQPLFNASMRRDGRSLERVEGKGAFSCTFEHLPLLPGTYQVMLHIGDKEAVRAYLPNVPVATFRIASPLRTCGFTARTAPAFHNTFPFVMVPYVWHHHDQPLSSSLPAD